EIGSASDPGSNPASNGAATRLSRWHEVPHSMVEYSPLGLRGMECLPSADPDWLARARQYAPRCSGRAVDVIPLGERLTFGRGPDCDVVLPADTVAPQHARLRLEDGGYFLSDLGTPTGTFVNGAPIRRACIVPGDRIQIGPYQFYLENGQLVCA